jgi:hypothetical protein
MPTSTKRPTEAWASSDLFESGFGQVVVARFKASGEVEAGVFLVDIYCLGVKNAFFSRLWPTDYEGRLLGSMDRAGGKTAIAPACARQLVEGAVAYARNLGIEPHRDYKQGARVFGGINPGDCPTEFVYGKDGKPLFISSPHDSPEFIERVLGMLTRRLGEGGFHSLVGLDDASAAGNFGGDASDEPPDDNPESDDSARN